MLELSRKRDFDSDKNDNEIKSIAESDISTASDVFVASEVLKDGFDSEGSTVSEVDENDFSQWTDDMYAVAASFADNSKTEETDRKTPTSEFPAVTPPRNSAGGIAVGNTASLAAAKRRLDSTFLQWTDSVDAFVASSDFATGNSKTAAAGETGQETPTPEFPAIPPIRSTAGSSSAGNAVSPTPEFPDVTPRRSTVANFSAAENSALLMPEFPATTPPGSCAGDFSSGNTVSRSAAKRRLDPILDIFLEPPGARPRQICDEVAAQIEVSPLRKNLTSTLSLKSPPIRKT